MAGSLTLIANPGSASRKYALYDGEHERAGLHFEWADGRVVCTLHWQGDQQPISVDMQDLSGSAAVVTELLRAQSVLQPDEYIMHIGLRIVAPSAYSLDDHLIDDDFVSRLEASKSRAPIHIAATLEELHGLRQHFKNAVMVGVSDSAFHVTKPDYAWNYGIPLHDADRFEIKRFGYHGLSAASAVRALEAAGKLPPRLVVCHLGSGASVTAIHDGKSVDTTMGYSPLEGVVMSTRSGSIDPTAVRALKEYCHFDDEAAEAYLNNHSGLLGLSGSSDIRELLRREADGDDRSRLGLATYVHSIQKAVGQMAAALDGADALAFTGTVGERSAPIRQRISDRLHYLDLALDDEANTAYEITKGLTNIGRASHSKPIFVVPADEAGEMIRRTLRFKSH